MCMAPFAAGALVVVPWAGLALVAVAALVVVARARLALVAVSALAVVASAALPLVAVASTASIALARLVDVVADGSAVGAPADSVRWLGRRTADPRSGGRVPCALLAAVRPSIAAAP